ncbi:uncharacterized protein LOC124163347 [Ischnura elegans]|uniref:uncharacterized protein LOC124163347 n=1 Tax=Ischnura elegans TaxID=197161 RepID=UPI001ED8BCC9|nr:uncharacterized protein LOC124163347 [Ischnura elegans]
MDCATPQDAEENLETEKRTVELPIEVVTHILSYVSLSDRIIASRVCRVWREAALDPRLHSDTAWVIRDDLSRPAHAVCRGHSSSLHPPPTCLHLVLNDVEIKVSDVSSDPSGTDSVDSSDCQSPEAQFWEQYGPSLRSLWLNCCEASERAFPILLRRCPRLRSLSVSSCREMLMSGRLLANEVESSGGSEKPLNQMSEISTNCAESVVSKGQKETKHRSGPHSPFRKLFRSKKTDKTATKGCLSKSVMLERQNAVRDRSRTCDVVLVRASSETVVELLDGRTKDMSKWKETSASVDLGGDLSSTSEADSVETSAVQSCDGSDSEDLCCEGSKEQNEFACSSSQVLEGPLILPELKELRLASNRYLSDALFERFVALSPELESLSLSGCHLTFHQGIYRRFYPHRWDQYQQRMAAILGAAPWMEAEPSELELEKDDGPISESVLTFQNVLRYFRRRKRQGGKLLRLSLGHTLVDNASLVELARDVPQGLRSLHLRACEQISSLPLPRIEDIQQEKRSIESSLENQRYWWSCLTELDLSLCPRLTDTSLEEICVLMGQKLRSLALRRCGALTDTGVSALFHCVALEKIDISECCQVTAGGLLAGICSCNVVDPQDEKAPKKSPGRPSLRRLYASELSSGVGGLETVKEMVMTLPNGITHLDLGSWSIRIEGRKISGLTDEVVATLVGRLKSLQILRLSGADGLTDAGLMGLIDLAEFNASDKLDEHPPTLGGVPQISSNPHHISLMTRAEAEIVLRAKKSGEVCKQRGWMEEKWERMMRENSDEASASDDESKPLAPSFCPVPQSSVVNLTGLQELDLSRCFSITDLSLKYAIRFRELRHLNLSHCLHISDIGLSFLSEYNPSLETLLLAFCPGINDAGIEHVVKGLHRLKHFDLQGCRELTDKSLQLVAQNCKDLRYLDVSGCLWMSLEAAEETEAKLSPPLHSLHRRGLAPKATHKTSAEGGDSSARERAGDDGKSGAPKPPPAPPLMNSLLSILAVYR